MLDFTVRSEEMLSLLWNAFDTAVIVFLTGQSAMFVKALVKKCKTSLNDKKH